VREREDRKLDAEFVADGSVHADPYLIAYSGVGELERVLV
jgi:hypothetical protein